MKRHSIIVALLILPGLHARQDESCKAQSQTQRITDPKSAGKQVRKANPELLKQYVGRYELEVGIIPVSTLDVTVDRGELWVKPSLVKKRRLLPQSETLFIDELEKTSYTFGGKIDGKYSTLTFSFEGSEYSAQRIVLPPPSLIGNTTFRLKEYADANIVALAGSFNDWNQSSVLCGRQAKEWICRIDLKPGAYSYKFVVDGNWVLDPENTKTALDEVGNTNNVLIKQ